MTPEELRRRLDFTDEQLLAECQVDYHRVKGPGGQHRNKVASAVRLRHTGSELVVTGVERRSQHENKANALERLREGISLIARAPLPPKAVWPAGVTLHNGLLRVSSRHPAIHQVIAIVLDALSEERGRLKEAAARIDVTPSSLTRFLSTHPKAWRTANEMREKFGLGPLRS